MKTFIITAIIAILVFGCRPQYGERKNIQVDSSYMVHVNAKDASVNADNVRIFGPTNIVYDTCQQEIYLLGFGVRGATKGLMRGLIIIGDTVYFTPNSEIRFYKGDTLLRVMKGGWPVDSLRADLWTKPSTPKPSPLPKK